MREVGELSLRALIDATLLALEQMDAPALEKLALDAQSMQDEGMDAGMEATVAGSLNRGRGQAPTWAAEAADANQVLRQLLEATDRNLALLRRLRAAGGVGLAERPGIANSAVGYAEKFQRDNRRGGAWLP